MTYMIEVKDLELAAKQIADSADFYKKIVNKKVGECTESMWQKFIKEQNAKVIAFWEGKK